MNAKLSPRTARSRGHFKVLARRNGHSWVVHVRTQEDPSPVPLTAHADPQATVGELKCCLQNATMGMRKEPREFLQIVGMESNGSWSVYARTEHDAAPVKLFEHASVQASSFVLAVRRLCGLPQRPSNRGKSCAVPASTELTLPPTRNVMFRRAHLAAAV